MDTVKTTLLAITLCAVHLHSSAADPKPNTESDWKRHLSTHIYKIGISRAKAEKLLNAKVLIEFPRDHGFTTLRDVYYAFDPSWVAVIAYRPADKMTDYPGADRPTMRLIVQPYLTPNQPGLIDELRQIAIRGSSNPK